VSLLLDAPPEPTLRARPPRRKTSVDLFGKPNANQASY
jgi:hypothetical protein